MGLVGWVSLRRSGAAFWFKGKAKAFTRTYGFLAAISMRRWTGSWTRSAAATEMCVISASPAAETWTLDCEGIADMVGRRSGQALRLADGLRAAGFDVRTHVVLNQVPVRLENDEEPGVARRRGQASGSRKTPSHGRQADTSKNRGSVDAVT